MTRDASTAAKASAEARPGLPHAALGAALRAIEAGDPTALGAFRGARRAHGPAAAVVAITGAAGVGKSTLIGKLLPRWRASGATVGVLTVDPSSPRSGGALLGDRLRFGDAAEDAGVFVRSFASRGAAGGLSAAVEPAIAALLAHGCDRVLLETVGVGQADIDAALVADRLVLVVAPGGGDWVQAMKAGVIELADVVVVHKADLPGAALLREDLEAALALAAWAPPPIVEVSSSRGVGLDTLVDALAQPPSEARWSPSARLGLRLQRAASQRAEAALEALWHSDAGLGLRDAVAAGALEIDEAAARAVAWALAPPATHRER